MCGIWIYYTTNEKKIRPNVIDYFNRISHRGPDSSTILKFPVGSDQGFLMIGFHRLSINDTTMKGNQPMMSDDGQVISVCNGEIYNYHQLLIKTNGDDTEHYRHQHQHSTSDCQVIIPLYLKEGRQFSEMVKQLDAECAIGLFDAIENKLHLYRDRYGVRPLFYSQQETELFISSEAKGIPEDHFTTLRPFPPGFAISYQLGDNGKPVVDLIEMKRVVDNATATTTVFTSAAAVNTANAAVNTVVDPSSTSKNIQHLLETAVKKRLMSDRPLGCFLSGGVDSSLVTSIVWRNLTPAQREEFQCFTIGLEGSVDVKAAKEVVAFLGIHPSQHHIINFTVEEGFAVLPEVIRAIESYDITTIRASVPQYILSKYIREKTSIRVLLSGEGSDELFGGYQYFKMAPTQEEFHQESLHLLDKLYLFDNLRTDRTTAAHGLEVRVPFLDFDLVDYVNLHHPLTKPLIVSSMEKMPLRDAFDDGTYLPSSVLYRRKEAFSDAVSSKEVKWYEELVKLIQKTVTSQRNCSISNNDGGTTPTIEASYYKSLFNRHYPASLIPFYWMPRWVINRNNNNQFEPSATKLECYQTDY